MRAADPNRPAHCLARPDCCAKFRSMNPNCYVGQCRATAGAIATALGLRDDQWEVSFQAGLGRTPWIHPHSAVRFRELAEEGCRRIAVAGPAFVADCLETIEEVGNRGRDIFLANGGEELILVPCPNSGDRFVRAIADMVAIDSAATI